MAPYFSKNKKEFLNGNKKEYTKKRNNFKFKKNKIKVPFFVTDIVKSKATFLDSKKRLLKLKRSFSRVLHIRINPNNVFFNLKKISKRKKSRIKTIAHASSGTFKIKLSKKRIKYNIYLLLDSFLKKIRKHIYRKNLVIVLISPKHLNTKIVKFISELIKKRNLIFYLKPLKCFNGCRPPKKRRRKQKGLRILKK